LAKQGCTLVGIEANPDSVIAARSTGAYEEVLEIDLDDGSTALPDQRFDVVLCADVLEHLRQPETVLRRLCKVLTEAGLVVVSLPNVAHVSTRLQLLAGKFTYTQTGILDRTHLHLYTYRTATELLHDAGLQVESALAGSNRFGDLLSFGPRPMRMLRGLLAYNIVLVARLRKST
jgi:2-polyprenyl-3-methyl-5-hydroxy-6-metoxy-1,4-benzoquinol methylase